MLQLVDKSQRNSRASIPWRGWSTVSIFRHIFYFCHERTTMASETSENTIFVRFYFTRCYVMLTPRMSLCRILVLVLKWEHETGPLSVFTWRHSNHVPKQRNGQPCWCSQLILREFQSILMQTFSLSFCFRWKTCALITWVKNTLL